MAPLRPLNKALTSFIHNLKLTDLSNFIAHKFLIIFPHFPCDPFSALKTAHAVLNVLPLFAMPFSSIALTTHSATAMLFSHKNYMNSTHSLGFKISPSL